MGTRCPRPPLDSAPGPRAHSAPWASAPPAPGEGVGGPGHLYIEQFLSLWNIEKHLRDPLFSLNSSQIEVAGELAGGNPIGI